MQTDTWVTAADGDENSIFRQRLYVVTDFTARHWMQGGLVTRKVSVRLSVCLSVNSSGKRVQCDKTEERSVHTFIPYERTLSLVLWEGEWLGATPSTRNFGLTGPRWSEIAVFQSIFARNASAVAPSKKVQLTLIGSQSTMRFPMSPRWTSYVAPNTQRGSKT